MQWLLEREFKTKCLVASGLAVGGYALLPKRSAGVAVMLALSVYIGLAYYDWAFDCSDKMRPLGGLVLAR